MDSLKRVKEDSKVEISPLDSDSSVHVIRSHRRPSVYSFRRPIAIMLIITLVAPALVTSALPVARPEIPSQVRSAAPLEFPSPPYVAPEKANEGAPVRTLGSIERASRAATRGELPKPPAPPEPSKIERVIAYALAQQGDRYVWGASGPNSFDCSGLVMMAFRQIGIQLPHYTGTMINHGTRVNRSALQRGDIIFPSSGHVVIYLGDGLQVAASSGKGRVVIQKVSGFYAARRLV